MDRLFKMNFTGIDVGSGKYFLVSYYQDKRNIETNRFDNPKDICVYLKTRKGVIAIDAPSGPRKNKDQRRQCEKELGIGGYFATPYDREMVQSWMKSGFELWENLQAHGFKRAVSSPVKNGFLIEVHPTVIFKKLMNPNAAPILWISRRNPISKARRQGKTQRREILNKIFPEQESKINNLGIDYIDALIAAYIAEKASKGEARPLGNPEEGQIWFPME